MSIHDTAPHTRGSLAAVCGITNHTVGHRILLDPVASVTRGDLRYEVYRHPDHDVDCHVAAYDSGKRSDGTVALYGPLEDCLALLRERRTIAPAPETREPDLTVEDACDRCGEIGRVNVVGPCGGVLAFCADTQACQRRVACVAELDVARGERIRAVDDVVFAQRDTAYVSDDHGVVANPQAPRDLRDLMALLAVLMLDRDGCWPTWWRQPGEPPDRDHAVNEEAPGLRTVA